LEDNIKIDIKQRGYEVVDWINLAPNRDVWLVLIDAIINFQIEHKRLGIY
jgi:hypothetical protein